MDLNSLPSSVLELVSLAPECPISELSADEVELAAIAALKLIRQRNDQPWLLSGQRSLHTVQEKAGLSGGLNDKQIKAAIRCGQRHVQKRCEKDIIEEHVHIRSNGTRQTAGKEVV